MVEVVGTAPTSAMFITKFVYRHSWKTNINNIKLYKKYSMIKKFLDLGKQPITNSFLKKINKKTLNKEFFYNLSVGFNDKNFLVSLMKHVDPKKQFTSQYAHRASQSQTMRKSFKEIAIKLKKRFKPKNCLEIGSNDGVFIKNFRKNQVVAVEPCTNLAKITQAAGYKTYGKFWNKKIALKIKKLYGNFDLIFSANTISHIPNLKEVFESISTAISEKGVFVFEDPYIGSVIQNNSYDQFYDEHVHLFSLISISKILLEVKLKVFDVEITKNHGGSIRFYVCKKNSSFKETKRFKLLQLKEIRQGLHKLITYKKFSNRVQKSKRQLIKILKNLKRRRKKIISYGATYKSATIFNYCNIGTNLIDYVIDTTPNKQGKFTPGKHIPIISPEVGFNDSADYAFLGAWNFKKEIKEKEKKFINRGGKFITHVPVPKII